MIYAIVIIAVIIAALLIARLLKKSAREKQVTGNLPIPLPPKSAFQYQGTTTRNIFYSSVVFIPSQVFDVIDRAIENLLNATRATRPHWNLFNDYKFFNVIFIDEMATNQDGSPALIVRGIQSAGTVIGIDGDGYAPICIVVPHQKTSNWTHLEYLKHSIWNEGEHVVEWVNDRDEFYRFAIAGDKHLHRPLPLEIPEV